jgi:ribosomal protein S21
MMASEEPQSDSKRAQQSQPDSRPPGGRGQVLAVVMDDRGIEVPWLVFKRLVLEEGLLKDLERHACFEKPGDRKHRKTREAIRRRRQQAAPMCDRFGERG